MQAAPCCPSGISWTARVCGATSGSAHTPCLHTPASSPGPTLPVIRVTGTAATPALSAICPSRFLVNSNPRQARVLTLGGPLRPQAARPPHVPGTRSRMGSSPSESRETMSNLLGFLGSRALPSAALGGGGDNLKRGAGAAHASEGRSGAAGVSLQGAHRAEGGVGSWSLVTMQALRSQTGWEPGSEGWDIVVAGTWAPAAVQTSTGLSITGGSRETPTRR